MLTAIKSKRTYLGRGIALAKLDTRAPGSDYSLGIDAAISLATNSCRLYSNVTLADAEKVR